MIKTSKVSPKKAILTSKKKKRAVSKPKNETNEALTFHAKDEASNELGKIANSIQMKTDSEEKMSSLNQKKILVKWREILRSTSKNELKTDIQYAILSCEEMLKKKDKVIAHLLQTIKVDEEEYKQIIESFSKDIVLLKEIHVSRLEGAFRLFEKSKGKINEDNDYKMQILKDKMEQRNMQIKNLVENLESKFSKKMDVKKSEHQYLMDSINERDQQIMKDLLMEESNALENSRQQFSDLKNEYHRNNDELIRSYEEIKEKVFEDDDKINRKDIAIKSLTESIAKDRLKLTELISEQQNYKSPTQIQDLKVELQFTKNKAKKRALKFNNSLKEITIDSDNKLKELENIKQKLQSIVSRKKLCDKLLTKSDEDFNCDFKRISLDESEKHLNGPKFKNFLEKIKQLELSMEIIQRENCELNNANAKMKGDLRNSIEDHLFGTEIIHKNSPMYVEKMAAKSIY